MKNELLSTTIRIAIIVSCLSLVSCNKDNVKHKVNGYFTLTKQNEKDFKILQLTDIHMTSNDQTIELNGKIVNVNDINLDSIDKLVYATNPDLIVVTGDMVYTANNNLEMLQRLIEHLESYKIPYAPIFGNHDEEFTSLYNKAELCDYLESDTLKYCLFERGYCDDQNSMGNYVINIVNKERQLVQSLFLIDSHSTLYNEDYEFIGYDCIHEAQLEWYEEEIFNLKKLKQLKNITTPSSLAFFHIPLQEYLQAWNSAMNNEPTSFFNWESKYNKLGEDCCYALTNSGFFDKALELGSTKAMFCGHDHLNHFSINYKGIDLTYGLSIDYYVYSSIANKQEQRGGTLTSIKDDGSYIIEPIRLSELQ